MAPGASSDMFVNSCNSGWGGGKGVKTSSHTPPLFNLGIKKGRKTVGHKILSTVRAPVFRHSEHYGKALGSLLSGWINYNYTACCWFPTSSNILILPSQSDQSGLKVADCTVQSAIYWCFYGKCYQWWKYAGIPIYQEMNRATDKTKQLSRLLKFIKIYKQNSLGFFFTIYQNYKWL